MKISLISVGTKMPDWVLRGVDEYQRRFPPDFSFELLEVALARRGKNVDIARAMKSEADALIDKVPAGDYVVALDVKGKMLSTSDLAGAVDGVRLEGRNLSLLVGGPDGLDSACLTRADARWSLSALTLPHPLVRVLVAEQCYRVWSILHNHPYHRA